MRHALLLKLTIAAGILTAIAIWLASGHDVVGSIRHALDLLRSLGAPAFFLAMALLPAAGAPLSFFSLTAGSIFGPQLGMPGVIALSLTAIAINVTLSYFLASRWLRPLLERLLQRMGYNLPQVPTEQASDLIVLLRVTPGLPFPVQNYLLGLARVPFGQYLVISCLIAFPLNVAILIFGEAVLEGRGRIAMIGLLVLLALMAGIQLIRRHFRRHQPAAGQGARPRP